MPSRVSEGDVQAAMDGLKETLDLLGVDALEGLLQPVHRRLHIAFGGHDRSDRLGHLLIRSGQEHTPEVLRARHVQLVDGRDRKSTRLNSSHVAISYAVFCLKTKKAGQPTAE